MTTSVMIRPMTLYLGGQMLNRKGFGSGDFNQAAEILRSLPWVKLLFNPAENDKEHGFDPTGRRGTIAEMDAAGFSRTEALHQDFEWINQESEGMIALHTWKKSPGTFGEMAYHQALYRPVWPYRAFVDSGGDPAKLREAQLPSLRELIVDSGLL
jgi:hypothetical protein